MRQLTYRDQEIGFMNLDETDFSRFTLAQQIRHFEMEGFVVLPQVLEASQVEKIKSELESAPMIHKDYSKAQTVSTDPPQWQSEAVGRLISHIPTVQFLEALLGEDILFTRGFFQRSLPGCPGISLHTDGQPYGSSIFDFEGSSPRLVRVLYYLDDLTPERAPFRLVPRSHLSFHADANPYLRYKSHPEEITLCLSAGSAVIIPKDLFHGSHPNRDSRSRELIQFGFRPGWAGPIQPLDEWSCQQVASVPKESQRFLQSLNRSGGVWALENKPKGMKSQAPGLNPSRWEK